MKAKMTQGLMAIFLTFLCLNLAQGAEKKGGKTMQKDKVQNPVGTQTAGTATAVELVFIKGGCYQRGDASGDGFDNEKPVHETCIDDFYMGKHEVTQKQWTETMGSNPSYFKDSGGNCPVEQVSWNDVQEFIKKLNQKTGKKYRLPTEAEWEYAARSGGKEEEYSGGDDIDSVAWYNKNSENKTHPAGQKQPNGLGLYDMSGNVWEWVADWYGEKYYSSSPKNNPKGPDSGQYRVLRGGSWNFTSGDARATNRNWGNPGDSDNSGYGFRLVSPAR